MRQERGRAGDGVEWCPQVVADDPHDLLLELECVALLRLAPLAFLQVSAHAQRRGGDEEQQRGVRRQDDPGRKGEALVRAPLGLAEVAPLQRGDLLDCGRREAERGAAARRVDRALQLSHDGRPEPQPVWARRDLREEPLPGHAHFEARWQLGCFGG